MKVRVATFNVENLDVTNDRPYLEERIEVLRPYFVRMDADVFCLQEVHGQEMEGEARSLMALERLFEGTKYADYSIITTQTSEDVPYDKRNLIIATRFDVLRHEQYRNDILFGKLQYRKVTAQPADEDAKDVNWERPILYTEIAVKDGLSIHVINLHLKSRLSSSIPGRNTKGYWETISSWAEGSFLSTIKRVGQALEARMLIDSIFDNDPAARVLVAGDFNADLNGVATQAIRGEVKNTLNYALGAREMLPCEQTIPESSRYTLFHHGHPLMFDHILISKGMLGSYRFTEVHNELLPDESVSYHKSVTDKLYPESDHAPVVAEFEF